MKKYTASINEEVVIVARATGEAKEIFDQCDIILLGAQVKFMEANCKQIAKEKPVVVIPPQIYSIAKGEECFNLALEHLNN